MYNKRGNYEQAIRSFEQTLALRDNYIKAELELVRVNLMLDRPKEASEWFRQVSDRVDFLISNFAAEGTE